MIDLENVEPLRITQSEIESAAALIAHTMQPTAQYRWPILCELVGTDVWTKHENHTPIAAFKIRGGLIYIDDLVRTRPEVRGVITATRGNHGQSIALAGARAGLAVTVVVPRNNSREKNNAMRAFGAEVLETGDDFQSAREEMVAIADERRMHIVPTFAPLLVLGVSTGAYELFTHVPDLEVVYVSCGLGSGLCGTIAARDALKRDIEIVGVVAEHADAYARSFAAGKVIVTDPDTTIADGLAVRVPDPRALATMLEGVSRFVRVSEAEIENAMRTIYSATHNIAEGAGAAAFAALSRERPKKKAAFILSGSNVDRDTIVRIFGS